MRISDWSSDVCSSDLDGLETLLIPTEEIFGRYSAYDLVNEATGEIYIEAGDEVSAANLEKMDAPGIDKLVLIDIDHNNPGPWIRNTLTADKAEHRDQAQSDINRPMRRPDEATSEPQPRSRTSHTTH